MLQLNLMLLSQAVLGIGFIMLLHKISKMRKQIDETTQKVQDYVAYITECEDAEEVTYKSGRVQDDEQKSALLQAVLGDIFP